jgi:predicted TIM-barrel fold metal-dependent hydrolase
MIKHIPPIFDSSTHPTLDGTWTLGRTGLSFDKLREIRVRNRDYRALAIGLPGVGNYSHERYIRACEAAGVEAIAALTRTEKFEVTREIEMIASLGYRGIKIHPRLLGANRELHILPEAFSACVQHDIVCLLCTYEASSPGSLAIVDPLRQINDALNAAPETRLILMHGGFTRVMEYAGLARHSETILLDLSFTIMEMVSNSVESDIRYLMSRLDQRICIGSDSPEFEISQFVRRIGTLLGDLPSEKQANISSANLLKFFPT